MDIKICGITKPDQAEAIANLGADYLGYICVPSSPRYVTPNQVQQLSAAAGRAIAQVGVFMDASLDDIALYLEQSYLNAIQLHGAESPAFCAAAKLRFPEARLIKAFRVKNSQTLTTAIAYAQWVDVVLLDAYDPNLAGGTGKSIEWQSLRGFHPNCDWWLAGGLNPENFPAAIAQIQPQGVDVSSGVEHSPGNKNLEAVKILIDLAKGRAH